jgi:hypothetical protein
MRLHLIFTLSLIEARLRLRRLGTLVALLTVVGISWAMIPDPHSGMTLLSIKSARVLYTSSALSFGSATLAALLFGLGGFYLVRGRIAEDLRSGAGGVIAATQVSNGLFLFGRWLGGVLYLFALIVALLLTMLVLHGLRGEGPIELLVYLQTYAILLLPIVFFSVSCAVLFDSVPVLMGKAGDVIFFFFWIAQLSMMELSEKPHITITSAWMFVDFSGMVISMINFKQVVGTTDLSVGISDFNVALQAATLPNALWSAQLIWMRMVTALIALLPLLPATWLFHRFSPDQVKLASARKRRTPLAFINHCLRPLAKLAQPLFDMAAAVPGFCGQVLADVALTLTASPAAIAVLGLSLLASTFVNGAVMAGVLIGVAVFWGILISDISTRDGQANLEQMTGTATGGISRRYLRQWMVSVCLGLMFMGVLLLRFSFTQPVLAASLLCGVLSLSALATLFGRCTRTSRMFLALFLFWIYVALNARIVPMIDVLGFNGVANINTAFTQLVIASTALFVGYVFNRKSAG